MEAEAKAALARGEVDRALELWAVANAGTATPGGLLEHAVLLHRLYRSAEAAHLWSRLLEHPGATADHWLAAGKVWFQAGRFGKAARFTEQALAARPDDPEVAAMHASTLERAGRVREAGDVAAEALTRFPAHARLVRILARIERRAGRFPEARERLERNLAEHPSDDDWRLRHELAAVLDRMEEYAGAMRELTHAKESLIGEAAKHRPAWRAMTARQWEVALALDGDRLRRWSEGSGHRRICLMPGFPRSGTTLLERILTAHPDCVGTDESGILATLFRDPIIFGAGSAAGAIAELDEFGEDELAAGRAEYFRCTEDVLGEAQGVRWLIEKDPLMTADLAMPLRLFPNAKILMPLRDPRDVVISFFFTIVPVAPNSVASSSLGDTCRYHGEVMRHWLLLRDRLDPSRWMESRYEDLIADPMACTRRLAEFLGIDWRQEMTEHHRAGGRVAGTPTYDDVSKPLYSRSLERWRNYAPWLEPHLGHLKPSLEAFGSL